MIKFTKTYYKKIITETNRYVLTPKSHHFYSLLKDKKILVDGLSKSFTAFVLSDLKSTIGKPQENNSLFVSPQ